MTRRAPVVGIAALLALALLAGCNPSCSCIGGSPVVERPYGVPPGRLVEATQRCVVFCEAVTIAGEP